MKTVQFLLLVLAGSTTALSAGASGKVDSLKRVLQTHAAIDKAEVLWSIAYELFDVDNPQALFYAERAYHEVWFRGDSLQMVKVGTTYGQLLRRMGKLDKSIEVSTDLVPIARRQNYRKYVKMLLNSLGVAYSFKENFAKALELFYETMHLKNEDGDSAGMALSYLNIGFALYKTHNHRASIGYSSKAIRLSNRLGQGDILTDACFNIASAYGGLEKHDSARYFYCRSLNLADRYHHTINLAQYYQGYAHTLFELMKMDSAKYYAQLAVRVGGSQPYIWEVTFGYNLLSRIALTEGNTNLSWYYLLKADSVGSMADEFPFLKLQALKQKSRYYKAVGNADAALKYLERYNRLSDSLYEDKVSERITAVQLEYEQRISKQKIEAQAEVLGLQHVIIRKNDRFIAVISLSLAVVGILAVSLYRSNRRVYQVNRKLDQKVMERTRELVFQRDELVHNREEQRLSRQKIYGELRSQIYSLTGIINLGKIDKISGPEQYLAQASTSLSKLEETAKKLNREDN